MSELVFGSNFTSGQDVRSEFGTTTLQNLSRESGRSMHTKIFGSTVTGDRVSNHDGTGKPVGTNQAMGQDCEGGSYRPIFNGNIDFYGGPTDTADCHYRWKYDTDPLFPSPSYTTEQTTPSNGSVSFTPSTFDYVEGDTVYCVLQVWNEYNDAVESDYVESAQESIMFEAPDLSQPSWTSSTVLTDGARCYLSFEYGDDEIGFDFRYRINGGTTQTGATLECENANVGTSSNPKEQVWQLDNLLGDPSTDTLEVQIKAQGDACHDDSVWSSWKTASEGTANRCPL